MKPQIVGAAGLPLFKMKVYNATLPNSFEAEGDTGTYAKVVSPLFIPSEHVAVAKRYVIKLDRPDGKIATKLYVHPAAGAKRQIDI